MTRTGGADVARPGHGPADQDRLGEMLAATMRSSVAVRIRDRVREQCDIPTWGWTRGGCFAFAEKLCAAHPGARCFGVCVYSEEGRDWPVDHAIVEFGGAYFDADGVFDARNLKAGRRILSKDDPGNPVAWFDDGFLNDREFALLGRILAKTVASYMRTSARPILRRCRAVECR